ncbi:MAG: F0F1 ATP synthase subunit epsilon [Clostridia bacterium]|nr:F0F1 ATP synthase subunit epsilon [Clostridia bacterium]
MKTFPLKISSPEGDLFHGEAVRLIVRGVEGELAVMAGHISFVTPVKACDCKVELEDGEEKLGSTDGGLLTVSGERVVLLSGSFTWKNTT